MVHNISTSRRELVVRVATLELLVADLIDLLWRVDPRAMEQVSREAAHDVEIQNSRILAPGVEAQRERIFSVLHDRQRKLKHRRAKAHEDA
jgi:hypothetical protein